MSPPVAAAAGAAPASPAADDDPRAAPAAGEEPLADKAAKRLLQREHNYRQRQRRKQRRDADLEAILARLGLPATSSIEPGPTDEPLPQPLPEPLPLSLPLPAAPGPLDGITGPDGQRYTLLLNSTRDQSDASTSGRRSPEVVWSSLPAACDPLALPLERDGGVEAVAQQLQKQARRAGGAKPANGRGEPPPLPSTSAQPGADARAQRKRQQVESFVLLLRRMLRARPAPVPGAPALPRLAVVDFGAGTGALTLPLAALFPECDFVGVEMKAPSAALLDRRAAAAGLTNCRAHLGMIESFTLPFDVCLALHACGSASDLALAAAQRQHAAFLVSPCCVGKLKFSIAGGNSFSSSQKEWTLGAKARVVLAQISAGTGLGALAESPGAGADAGAAEREPAADAGPTPSLPDLGPVEHPRSDWLRARVTPAEFEALAACADGSEYGLPLGALPRRAKAAVELDRLRSVHEAGGYDLFLTCLPETGACPKVELLVGLPIGRRDVFDGAGLGPPHRF